MDGGPGSDRYVWREDDIDGSVDIIPNFQPLFDTLVFDGIVANPATAQARDFLQANIDGSDTLLTFDFDGTPGPATGVNFSRFVRLENYQVTNAQLNLLQFVGAIEFT